MRSILAAFSLALSIHAAEAANRYSGRYSGACGDLACELDVTPAGPDRWTVRWTATDPADPADHSLRVLCDFRTTVELGSAVLGPAGVVDGVAVGRHHGRPFALFDLDPGRVSWSSSWEACPGIRPKAIYTAFGDQ
ncbi:hypothetical protein [uncultured Aureimonas sp.]|uniref:hypothetical protein n=1 Tax=uncultured Aureimonas sp. TaxID=1604662 RepID=UPI0025CEA1DC|nr:hypothetical protein [uncultured Aureimonas sp.]